MRFILKAFIGSILIHLIYIIYTIMDGYIKTKNYNPDMPSAWDNVDVLQDEVVFGMVISPFFVLFSFLNVSIICAIIIFSYEKLFKKKVNYFKKG